MILDLISASNQLSPNFLPSFVNKLTPQSYARLRQTCSFMNNCIQNAVDRFQIHIRRDDPKVVDLYFYKAEWPDDERGIFDGFHFKILYIQDSGYETTEEEDPVLRNNIQRTLQVIKCDKFAFSNYHNHQFLLELLPFLTGSTALKLCNACIGDEKFDLSLLRNPLFERFQRFSSNRCTASPNFRIHEICKNFKILKLDFAERWNPSGAIARIIQDIYNGADIGPLERCWFQIIGHIYWPERVVRDDDGDVEEEEEEEEDDEDEPTHHGIGPGNTIGNVVFTPIKDETSERYSFPPERWYFCEAGTRKLLLSVYTSPFFTGFDYINLFIIPNGDLSVFVEKLALWLYEQPPENSDAKQFPIDNSYLFELLKGKGTEEYGEIIKNFVQNLFLKQKSIEDEDYKKKYGRER